MASELVAALQLKDVYDIAQSVGEQFQLLVERFGNACMAELVNTVVGALEHLEMFVQDNQKLQARVCKLLLDNDSLLKESEQLKTESLTNAATLASVGIIKMEKAQITRRLESVREANNELRKQIEEFTSQSDIICGNKKRSPEDKCHTESPKKKPEDHVQDQEENDVMEVPRMRRRLAQSENELRRTRTKLLGSQSTLKCIVSENNSLKAELEESKAEVGLQTLQLKTGTYLSQSQQYGSPKFYKEDLLMVLKERNELKEELDTLRDELNMTRLQLRYRYQTDGTESELEEGSLPRQTTNTKVRDIVTSISFQAKKDNLKRGSKKTNSSSTII